MAGSRPFGGQQAWWQLPPKPSYQPAMAHTFHGPFPGADRLAVFGFWPDPVTGRLVPGHFVGPLPDSASTWESLAHLSDANCALLDHAVEHAETPFPQQVSIGTCSNDWLDHWSPSMGVYTVSVTDAAGRSSRTPFGVLCSCSTAAAPGHRYSPQAAYHICFNGATTEQVRIRMEYHHNIPWGPNAEDVAKAHHYATPKTEVGPAGCVVALQVLDGGGIALDVEVMRKGPQPQAPPWLLCVHKQVQRLLMLERVASLIAPVTPMPSPVRLHAALGPHRAALQMVGHDVLRLIALVAEVSRNPLADARAVTERAAVVFARGHLASMVAKSHILDLVEVPDMGKVQQQELAADVGEALCGSVLLEPGGTYTNVLGFCRWLAADDGVNAPREWDYLDLALRHLGGQTTCYFGHTETFIRLREVPKGDSDPERPSFTLEVTYEIGAVLMYERVGVRAQELQVGVQGAEPQWIEFDQAKGALMSPALKKPLPNKVSAWLNKRPFAPLCRVVHQKAKPLQYESLRELCTGVLIVDYTEYGMVEYVRSLSGQLGYEKKCDADGDVEPPPLLCLSYSEKNRAILSSVFPGAQIPNKVADWLRGFLLNLATLTTVHNHKAPSAPDVQVDVSNEACSWLCPERKVKYWVKGIAACPGIVYASYGEGEKKWAELVYMEKQKEWRIAQPVGLASLPLPVKVAAWLSAHLDRLDLDSALRQTTVQRWVEQQAQAPWLKEPAFVRDLLPKALQWHLAGLYKALGHVFQNPTLLAQAMTHPSKHLDLNYQRLALIGFATVELVVSMHLYEASSQETTPTCSAASTDPAVGAAQSPRKAPYLPPGRPGGHRPLGSVPLEFQQGPPPTETPTLWLGREVAATEKVVVWGRKDEICSHLAFARTAVALKLDLAFQHDSDTVAENVMRFAGRMRQSGLKVNISLKGLAQLHAPAELGDVFLACIGAVMMDGDGLSMGVRGLVETHVKLCQLDASDVTTDAQAEELPLPEELSQGGPSTTGKQVPDGLGDVAQYCDTCQRWFNGLAQLLDHKKGKRHTSRLFKTGTNPPA